MYCIELGLFVLVCLYVDVLVCWCVGVLVCWCVGVFVCLCGCLWGCVSYVCVFVGGGARLVSL